MDDCDLFISTFYGLPEQVIQELNTKKLQAQCIFTQQPDFEDEQFFVPAANTVLLQIRGNYVVQCQPKTKRIAGGMQICVDNKFQVKRRCDDPQAELGEPYAIGFYIPSRVDEDDEIVLKFGVRRGKSQQLEKFVQCLERKNIYQMKVHEIYNVLNRLLYSSTASLYTATHKKTGQPCIIKCISKQLFHQTGRNLKKAMERQFSIPHSFTHPNICKYYGLFDSQDSTYIVMERLDVNLWLYLHSPLFKTQLICQAIKVLHDSVIMHRDLKPENIVLRKVTNVLYEPVLIDFGLAEFEKKEPFVFTRCGTPGFIAPQIIDKQYPTCAHGRSSDIFSLGCVFHVLLLGKSPFDSDIPNQPRDVKQIIRKNTQCKIDRNHQNYERFSPQIKKLLFWMLEVDPKKRPLISQVLQSSLFDDLKDKTQLQVSKQKQMLIIKAIEGQRQKQRQRRQKQLKQKMNANAFQLQKQKKQKASSQEIGMPE